MLQSIILLMIVNKAEHNKDLDDKSKEILRSFIYVFWLLKLSKHDIKTQEIELDCLELWSLVLTTITEYGLSKNGPSYIVARYIVEIFYNESILTIKRISAISKLDIDLNKAQEMIREVSRHFVSHRFGNMLDFLPN